MFAEQEQPHVHVGERPGRKGLAVFDEVRAGRPREVVDVFTVKVERRRPVAIRREAAFIAGGADDKA